MSSSKCVDRKGISWNSLNSAMRSASGISAVRSGIRNGPRMLIAPVACEVDLLVDVAVRLAEQRLFRTTGRRPCSAEYAVPRSPPSALPSPTGRRSQFRQGDHRLAASSHLRGLAADTTAAERVDGSRRDDVRRSLITCKTHGVRNLRVDGLPADSPRWSARGRPQTARVTAQWRCCCRCDANSSDRIRTFNKTRRYHCVIPKPMKRKCCPHRLSVPTQAAGQRRPVGHHGDQEVEQVVLAKNERIWLRRAAEEMVDQRLLRGALKRELGIVTLVAAEVVAPNDRFLTGGLQRLRHKVVLASGQDQAEGQLREGRMDLPGHEARRCVEPLPQAPATYWHRSLSRLRTAARPRQRSFRCRPSLRVLSRARLSTSA